MRLTTDSETFLATAATQPECCRSLRASKTVGPPVGLEPDNLSVPFRSLEPLGTPDTRVGAQAPVSAASWTQPSGLTAKRAPGPLDIYAYSFWRNGGGSNPLGLAQYGGGQSGVIAAYRVSPQLSVMLRGAVAHDDVGEREVAAGLRWSPLGNRAVVLTAERRFRNRSRDAFAVYVSGGKSALPLPLDIKLDAYGQAGYVTGTGGGPFFDAQARATREFKAFGKQPARLGAGLWTGGQKGASRLDIGPTVGTDIHAGDTVIRVDADWRWRVAGDARPGNGPALTLSTSF